LVLFVSLLAILDFSSTYAALRLSGNAQVVEAGLIAKWALGFNGFPGLFAVDIFSIAVLIFLAKGVQDRKSIV
jgi:hypothetical protein